MAGSACHDGPTLCARHHEVGSLQCDLQTIAIQSAITHCYHYHILLITLAIWTHEDLFVTQMDWLLLVRSQVDVSYHGVRLQHRPHSGGLPGGHHVQQRKAQSVSQEEERVYKGTYNSSLTCVVVALSAGSHSGFVCVCLCVCLCV